MYFVHPQLKFNIPNLLNLFFCFLQGSNKKVFEKVQAMFPQKTIYFTDMGRTAFRLIIETFQLQNSHILMPAYICDIFYPLLKGYNISPVFLDIEKSTFNIKTEEIEKKITAQTKAILVCHTYGLPANLERVFVLAKKYNLKVIEDCAHTLGAKYNGNFIGAFGDAALFSLYKLFPTLRGGMVLLPKNTKKINLLATKFSFRDFISLLNCFSFFSFLFRKYAREAAQRHIRKEKTAQPSLINRVSLNIFGWQLKNLEKILEKRKMLGSFFQEELKKIGFETQTPENNAFTFLSALVPPNTERDEFVADLRKKGVFLTRIWHTPIILNQEAQKSYSAKPSQFPNTVEVAKRIVNFPLQNFHSKKDIKKMIKIIETTLLTQRG